MILEKIIQYTYSCKLYCTVIARLIMYTADVLDVLHYIVDKYQTMGGTPKAKLTTIAIVANIIKGRGSLPSDTTRFACIK